MHHSKRNFLRATAGLSMAGGAALATRLGSPFASSLAALGALAAHSSASAASSDYRAIVCLFMAGGNDSHNWVVPLDASSFAAYTNARSALALSRADLMTLPGAAQQPGRSFGMPQELSPLHELYAQGRLAVLANVGPLAQPTTKAQFLAGKDLPPKLFSHNDQQSSWQALAPEGARSGWGGRIGDALMSMNTTPVFTSVSATGNMVFLSGATTSQYQIGMDGAVAIGGLTNPSTLSSATMAAALRNTQYGTQGNALQAEYARVLKRSSDAYAALSTAMSSVNVPSFASYRSTANAVTTPLALERVSLAKQLRAVAGMMAAGQRLGMRRQVFMVSMGGFDTHTQQMRDAPGLMSTVAQSVGYFMSAVNELGLSNNVTLFTASDFGRTLTSNGSGTDHGWGSHHFIAGGAVRGGDIYGKFPDLTLGGADDLGSGRLLPSTSVTEYGATLARWMGVSSADLATVLPNVQSFGSSDLGFV